MATTTSSGIRDAIAEAELAYQFAPSSYSYATLAACLRLQGLTGSASS
jgi:hypothetical protein